MGGKFSVVEGKSRNKLAAVDVTTGKLASWNPYLSGGEVSTMTIWNNMIYIGGEFYSVGGQSRTNVAAVDAIEGKSTDWDLGFYVDIQVLSMANAHNRMYIGGYTGSILAKKGYLKAFDAGNGQTSPWCPELPDFSRSVNSLVSHNGAIYISFYGGVSATELGTVHYLAAFGREATLHNRIQGSIFEDINGDCAKQSGEKGLANWTVVAKPGNYYTSTDSLGNYTLAVDTGSYTVEQIIPISQGEFVKQVCPANPSTYKVQFTKSNETVSGKDFGNQISPKSHLSVHVSSSRRRRCFRSTTSISYSNTGKLEATNVKVYVKLPEYVVLVQADKPYQIDADNNYVFSLAKVGANEWGSITLQDSVICGNPAITGLTQCTKVWITPANQLTHSASWDKSDIRVKATCISGGKVKVGLYNAGAGSMADSSAFRIYLDGQLALDNYFKLRTNDSLILQVPTNGKTLRLEADQRPYHPRKSQSNATIEACRVTDHSKVSLGYVTLFPPDDEEPEVDVECLPIRDSFDPNDKLVSPEGLASEKYVPTDSELDYTIRFQNTGTDLAYKVVVVDTLSEHLDIHTLQVRGASHAYTFSTTGKGNPVLNWTFENIHLPDSSTNRLASHGFVHFSIKPKMGLPIKTPIENFADIFFDYNNPVRTNTTLNTVYDVPLVTVDSVKLDQASIVCLPMNQRGSAGANRTLCEQDTIHMHASVSSNGQGRWKKIRGTGVIEQPDSPQSTIRGLSFGENTFEWNVPLNSCSTDSLRARVTVIRYPKPTKPVISLVGTDSLRCSTEGEAYQWYWEGNALSSNSRHIRLTKSGHYTVQVRNVDCESVLSEAFKYVITGLEAIPKAGWNIYPNPTAGRFTIELSLGSSPLKEITIMDALGKNVLNQIPSSLNLATGEIDISACRPGTYFVKIRTSNGTFVRRLVKE